MALPRRISLLIFLSILFFSSCNLLGENRNHDDLEANRQTWQKYKIDNYEFEVSKACFCPEYLYPARVVVRSDTVNAVFDPETGESLRNPDTKNQVKLSRYNSINDLFEIVEEAIRYEADSIEVKYDRALGYPKYISIDYIKEARDDELTFKINNLRSQ